ncbi:MAG: energy transducer TonB [Myxococcota bacterium]
MFDRLHRKTSSDRRRQRSALLLALLLNFSGGASLMAVGSDQTVIMTMEDVVVVDWVEEEPRPQVVGPPGPPAPKPAAAPSAPASAGDRSPQPAPGPDPVPTPEDEVEPNPLAKLWETADPGNTERVSSGGSGKQGAADGIVGGTLNGPGGGSCPIGEDCSVLSVGGSAVVPRRRVKPEYSAAAKALGLEETTCRVTFTVDEKGRPADVDIAGCPVVFHPSVQQAAWQWRFYPVRGADGRPTRARFTLKLTFRLR